MFERVEAFFAARRSARQKRIDEEYTTMTAEERADADEAWRFGAAGGADRHVEREAERREDFIEGRPR
jgi:hypothetical protein